MNTGYSYGFAHSIRYVAICLLCMGVGRPAAQESWGKYTLLAPQGDRTTRLIDLSGNVYNSWSLNSANGYSSLLTPDRCLVRSCSEGVQKLSWEGDVIWSYRISNNHHDICALPNGNVLITVKMTATQAEITAAGIPVSSSGGGGRPGGPGGGGGLSYDKIIEVNGETGQTVWEWRFIDHVGQDTDPSLSNYCVISDNPQVFDAANRGTNGYNDWIHLNGLDYNPWLDQIVFSAKYLQEIFVIDHSTTPAEAASHSGGKAGKGGDFLYRYGYPVNYDCEGSAVFGTLHDARWSVGENYLASDNPASENYHLYAGCISVWSNTQVSGMVFEPDYGTGYGYIYNPGSAFGPASCSAKIGISGRSTNMGSAQPLPNGNMLIYPGSGSTVYEMSASGKQVWKSTAANGCCKVVRYSEAYVNGEYASVCENYPIGSRPGSSSALSAGNDFRQLPDIFPNPVRMSGELCIAGAKAGECEVTLYNMAGKPVYRCSGCSRFSLEDLCPGLYIVRILSEKEEVSRKLVITE